MSAAVLSLSGIQKSFAGTRALRDAHLSLYAGEVCALVGENGAGKSTLVRVLSGLLQPDAGDIQLDGRSLRIGGVDHARELGISVVHQECMVFDNLSVAENIFVAGRPSQRRLVAWRAMHERASVILRQLDADFDPDMLAGELSVAQKHIVQIARALTTDARVMILDEPTASLSHREVSDLFRIVSKLKAAGCAVLFITHKFEEIFAIADRYAVFRDGTSVGDGQVSDVDRDTMIRLMVGRDVEQLFPKLPTTIGEELLRVERLSRAGEFEDISFSVHGGEIVGVYGLVGAGRTELAQVLFGLTRADTGNISVKGQRVSIDSPAQAVKHGLALVPEDRQQQGAILQFTIADNICLPNLQTLAPRGFLGRARESALADQWTASLQVKSRDSQQNVADLSGGNQQKVVIAKWLARNPSVLILDEPTKGIDVGAKSAVHAVTSEFAQRGNGVLMISSELPEIMGMSDRILVMRRGRLRAQFKRSEATAEGIIRAATDA
ncbi:MAG: sugar ABC transporter ATP-binding protein [Steroidobacteraceae bacterium]